MVDSNMSPEQISWEMPIGIQLEAFYKNATKEDVEIAKEMYDSFCEDLQKFSGIDRFKPRHFAMAALNLARVSLLALAETNQQNDSER